MRASSILIRAGTALLAAALLSGCGKPEPQSGPLAASLPMQAQDQHHGAAPLPCTPTLWATSPQHEAVYGYAAANSPPCITLAGTYAGLSLHGPFSVAVGSSPHYLYVADLYDNRIVVFNAANGNYVKWLNTKLGGTPYNPWGVCVSPSGTLGVANIQQGTGQGNVEFFQSNAPNASLPTGDASGVLGRDEWCAFDSAGNFFVDGASAIQQNQGIAYLAGSAVGLPGQTLIDSGLGNASFWAGMYSRIDSPADQTLSVATAVGHSAIQTVRTWNVSGPPNGPLTFTPCTCSPYTFTNYPTHPLHGRDPVYQVAPGAGGASGTLYFADLGKGTVLQGPANGGNVSVYENPHSAIGVAANPAGQY
jgi:hypothetical protein